LRRPALVRRIERRLSVRPTGPTASVAPLVSESDFKSAVDAVSKAIDGAGVVVVVIGLLVATGGFLVALRSSSTRAPAYRAYRQAVGKAILLGLEFLVAADIIVPSPWSRRSLAWASSPSSWPCARSSASPWTWSCRDAGRGSRATSPVQLQYLALDDVPPHQPQRHRLALQPRVRPPYRAPGSITPPAAGS
jgi:hypothetical protein